MKFSKPFHKYLPLSFQEKIKYALNSFKKGFRFINPAVVYANPAYSQEGEDRILFSLFSLINKKNGFYVDVGAHHPFRFSNTFLLYRHGWSGINIDANMDAIALFRKWRPRDINVFIGVGEIPEKLKFYVFNEPALNTFDPNLAHRVSNNSTYKIVEERFIDVMPLSQILDAHLPRNQAIDLLSIDVEGKDFDVLKSNNWVSYTPYCVLVEYHGGFKRKEGFFFDEVLESDITRFLHLKGYRVFAKTLNTIFYVNKQICD